MFFRLDSNLLEMQHYSFAVVKFISIFVSIKTNQPIYMKRKIFYPLLCAVVMLGVMMTSCSKEDKLLSTIPSNVSTVVMADVKGILENSGCKFTAEGVTLPASITDIDSDDELLVALGKLDAEGVCSFSEVAVVLDSRKRTVCTFMVKDGGKFKELTPDFDWKDGEDGYDEGKVKGNIILTDGKQAWIVLNGNAYEAVRKLKEDAKEESVDKLVGIKGALESDNLVNAAFSGLNFGFTTNKTASQETVWNVMSANIKDNKIVMSSQSMKGDGEVAEVKGLQPINPAVLAYIPGSFNFVAAAGLTPEFDWKGLMSALNPMLVRDFQMQGIMAILTPFLQSLDGTVIFGAGPVNDDAYTDMEPANWQFVLMAHLSQERINQVMKMARGAMFQAGISPVEEKDGVMVVPQYGMNFYIGNVDGYLAVSNMPFDNTRSNSLAPLFVNKEAAVTVEIPSLRELSSMAPAYGIKLTVNMEGAKGSAELSLPGSDTPILETILNTIYD